MCIYMQRVSRTIYSGLRILRREFVGRFVFKESSIGNCIFWQRCIIESQLPVQFIRCIYYSSFIIFFSRIFSYFHRFRVIMIGAAISSLKTNRPYINRESRNRERKHSVYTYNLPTQSQKSTTIHSLPFSFPCLSF